MAALQSLEDQAYEAAGKNALTLFNLHRKKNCVELYRGFAKGFAEAYGALVGPTQAAELFFQLADAQCARISLDSDDLGVRAAIQNAIKSAGTQKT